jgi:DNA (cytosine-5)-methyltransferase 1
MSDVTFLDLFSGCGGFSLGLKKAGFKELASIDSNPEAVIVFRANFPDVPHILEEDLTRYQPRRLAKLIGTDHVDLIVGGPPCQGFSTVRQADGANSGERLVEDDRRSLYREFLRFVKFFKPKMFVMENVPGIRSAVGGYFFTRVQSEARKLGYRVHGEVVKAREFGVPQKRERQLIVGTKLELPLFSSRLHMPPTHGEKEGLLPLITLWEAIGDLPPIQAGGGENIVEYDLERRNHHMEKFGRRYILDVLEIEEADHLTAHRARLHSERDIRDFRRLHEGENSAQAIKRGEMMEFPYDRESFKDRYTRQHRNRLCSTIVAHLSKDGLMFIHPTQDRSLTPREAARIQSFPDWFQFPVAQTHQYRLIGNAVPPLVAKAVGAAIKRWLTEIDGFKAEPLVNIPANQSQAINWLSDALDYGNQSGYSNIPHDSFMLGWFAIAYLFGHLHPDSAKENGAQIRKDSSGNPPLLEEEAPQLLRPLYARSGWPVRLVPMAKEACRRFENGEMKAHEYYCSEAFVAGLGIRNGIK